MLTLLNIRLILDTYTLEIPVSKHFKDAPLQVECPKSLRNANKPTETRL